MYQYTMATIPIAHNAVCWPKEMIGPMYCVLTYCAHIFQGPRGPPGEIGSKVR